MWIAAAYRGLIAEVGRLCLSEGGRLVLSQVNRMNSRNGFALMTAT